MKTLDKKNSTSEQFIKCACDSEGIHLEYDKEIKSFYLSLWKFNYNPTGLSWKQKAKYIWRLLTKGEAWGHDIVLNKKSANKLVEFINEHNEI